MKRRLATIAAIVWTATSAFAAPPPPMWTGFYAGLNLGGGANTSTSVTTTGYSAFDWAAGVYNLPFGWTSGYRSSGANVGQAGVVGGGQFGYNFQFSPNVVLGVETDFQGSGISGNGSSYGLAGGSGNTGDPHENFLHLQSGAVNVSSGLGWIGTVRGRVGFLANPSILLYATGGFAYGETYASVLTTGYHWHPGHETAHPDNPVVPTLASFNAISVGWTVGGGAEWMFWENLSAKVEALYYDLGSQSARGQFSPVINPAAPNSIAIINGATTKFDYQGVIARLGVNYHFNFGAVP
jgi:outer membrane immunogenic protein